MMEKLNAADVCNRAVVIATEEMNLKEAANLMRTQHVGSLMVVQPARNGNRVVGVLTDRDIAVVAVRRNFDPQTLRVADAMTSDVVSLRPDDSLHQALFLMRERGVRRLPVTSDEGILEGIVTLDDLLEIFAGELQGFARAITSEQHHEVRPRP